MTSRPDLDALAQQSGAVGATSAAPTGGVDDLDALAQQSGAVGATPKQQQQQPSVVEQAIAGIPFSGAVKGAVRSLAGLADVANKTPLIPGTLQPGETLVPAVSNVTNWIRQHTQPLNAKEEAEMLHETVAELMTGEGEASAAGKAAGFSDQLLKGSKIAKILEDYPTINAAVQAGRAAAKSTAGRVVSGAATGATRAGVEQGAQTYVKTGGDAEAAMRAGGTGAVIGGVFGGASPAVEDVAGNLLRRTQRLLPGTEQIAGVEIPTATETTAKQFAPIASEVQPAIRQAFANQATRTLRDAVRRLGTGAEVVPVGDYGQAADQLATHADGIYNDLDQLTEGRFRQINGEIQDAKHDYYLPNATSAEKAAAQARIDGGMQRMDELLGGFEDPGFSAHTQQLANRARGAFADHYTLDTIHRATNKAFEYPSEATAAGAGRTVNQLAGKTLTDQLNAMERSPQIGRDKLVSVLGEDGLANLHKLGDAANVPETREAVKNILTEMAGQAHTVGGKTGFAGGLIGYLLGGHWAQGSAVGYGAGATLGAGNVLYRRALSEAATNPTIGRMLTYAAQRGISPRYAARLIGIAINQPQNQPPATQQRQPSPYMAEPNPQGLVEPGNLSIWNRPIVENADGSHSSEYSTSFTDDQGREVLVPTIVNGRFLTPDGKKPPENSPQERAMFQRAWKHYQDTGEHLGKFASAADADRYANILHNRPQAQGGQ
jgi:hypothetical protein